MDNNKKKFYEMDRDERLEYVRKATGISDIETMLRPLAFEDADRMVENAIGVMSVPMGIATNFVINGREYMIPMAIEEPSVIAAASKAARIAKINGGFTAEADESLMIGQVQVVGAGRAAMQKKILKSKKQLLAIANSKSRSVIAIDLKVRQVRDTSPNKMGSMLLVELIVDTKDAMGANAINTMCEAIAPTVAEIAGGEVVLKILSNYATKRMARCKAVFDKEELGGSEIVRRILYAYALAHSDVYRAVTHNKGIMNGIDAVALATGQDFRAIEAGAHAYAARDGTYRSLTRWRRTREGNLAGEIELPLAVGIVGGVVNAHPTAKLALQILGAKSAKELAMAMAAAGLAQNLAAIRALSAEGIQAGHMRLHSRKFSK
ncbi:3-hydroxy-3-methylglutaryl-coenzyme A reductase [Candidatus Nitrososphaera gargensis Ga9.2]|uniref:3-hydroxy-3-methylglutaryl coenzyme A reductase n=1 Tax=Nitrososphaera gargensis (strain Ga9.2) TaxID=1237085 RepID=K0IJ04_NITGG|nr:hydroxymethylglutaryl-CoA reductase, degradative [Candidatus Nitrososphaera gargensis]AFU59980.1 3-hydroxy-3-methylglutaryl-coenzyme A reductase [Candidatus Nitrososphaera gargensis Ga9.2]